MKLISSYEGKIALIAFATDSLPAKATEDHQSIFDAFDPEVQVLLIVRPEGDRIGPVHISEGELQAKSLQFVHQGRLIRCISTVSQVPDPWIQDHFFVMVGEEGETKELAALEDDTHRWRTGWLITNDQGYNYGKACPNLVPGNVLAINGYLLVGADAKYFEPEVLCQSCNDFCSHFAGEIVRLGLQSRKRMRLNSDLPSYQPFFHLDLYVAPLGKIEDQLHFSVAELRDEFVYQSGRSHPGWLAVKGNIAEGLDETARQLKDMGFVVHRHPAVLHLDGANIVHFSFHNMKFEQFGEIRRAYLPAYDGFAEAGNDLETMLKYCRKKFEEEIKNLGIEVRSIHNKFFPQRAERRGSLHCFSKVLARTKI